ncbi:hypothetical protein AYI68_g1377 [Smittium mucronatum]|uniref:Uncharacterized protein n=1 Tax=Smittium mucronatum TaxID=133383 RepID=A0A1R0H5N3_9FUNG|nr:hypothetical protein AYI68_g1377 [Smittium mucronatum]
MIHSFKHRILSKKKSKNSVAEQDYASESLDLSLRDDCSSRKSIVFYDADFNFNYKTSFLVTGVSSLFKRRTKTRKNSKILNAGFSGSGKDNPTALLDLDHIRVPNVYHSSESYHNGSLLTNCCSHPLKKDPIPDSESYTGIDNNLFNKNIENKSEFDMSYIDQSEDINTSLATLKQTTTADRRRSSKVNSETYIVDNFSINVPPRQSSNINTVISKRVHPVSQHSLQISHKDFYSPITVDSLQQNFIPKSINEFNDITFSKFRAVKISSDDSHPVSFLAPIKKSSRSRRYNNQSLSPIITNLNSHLVDSISIHSLSHSRNRQYSGIKRSSSCVNIDKYNHEYNPSPKRYSYDTLTLISLFSSPDLPSLENIDCPSRFDQLKSAVELIDFFPQVPDKIVY